ncbi:MAG TPA: hypothetical protein VE130_14880 [Nitrososphaeraceae archaeon]|nr:hypothetical protein [Nitrososphaeraceae archaeon]
MQSQELVTITTIAALLIVISTVSTIAPYSVSAKSERTPVPSERSPKCIYFTGTPIIICGPLGPLNLPSQLGRSISVVDSEVPPSCISVTIGSQTYERCATYWHPK